MFETQHISPALECYMKRPQPSRIDKMKGWRRNHFCMLKFWDGKFRWTIFFYSKWKLVLRPNEGDNGFCNDMRNCYSFQMDQQFSITSLEFVCIFWKEQTFFRYRLRKFWNYYRIDGSIPVNQKVTFKLPYHKNTILI